MTFLFLLYEGILCEGNRKIKEINIIVIYAIIMLFSIKL